MEHHLKVLKLPTFLREYGKVGRQSAAKSVDHPGYLLRLSGQRVQSYSAMALSRS